MLKYISHTSLTMFYADRDRWVNHYIIGVERVPQTEAMSVGSAFDAYVKSHLQQILFGSVDPAFEFDTLFEAQVEEHNRDFARVEGGKVWKYYKESGALADLLTELQAAEVEPNFETTIFSTIDGVPILGKPDIYFTNAKGELVIYDWKVNGWCSSRRVSPRKGYVKIRGGRNDGEPHKDVTISIEKGMFISNFTLEECDEHWAGQLGTYGMVLGGSSSSFLVGIEQIVGNEEFGVRVASYRNRIGADFISELKDKYKNMWAKVVAGEYWDGLSKEECEGRIKVLRSVADATKKGGEKDKKWW